MPQPAVPQDLLDHVALRRLDEGDDLHLAAALGTLQRVDLVDPLDEHGPGLAARLAGWMPRRVPAYRRGDIGGRRCRFGRLPPQPAGLVRVPAVIADQMRALGRNVLGELGQEIQRREDLEIPLRPGRRPSPCGSGKARQASFSAL